MLAIKRAISGLLCLIMIYMCRVDCMACNTKDMSVIYPEAVEHMNSNSEKQLLYFRTCMKLDDCDERFHTMLSDLCSLDFWNSKACYNACNWLIIPMHYAIKSGDDYAVECFRKLFTRFTDYYMRGGEDEFYEIGRVYRLQWFYLCSQYLALCTSFDSYYSMFDQRLLDLCIDHAEENLYFAKATWGTERTVEEHLKQVLTGKKYKYHYYSWITDSDMFTLAILCDTIYVSLRLGLPVTSKMKNAAALAFELFRDQNLNTLTKDGGWLFQVGVLQDYKDFLYAGNSEITEEMQPNPRQDITWDVSHFRRLAFFLTSYESAQETVEGKELFALRREQLGNQLRKCVVKVGGNWVQTSFMDGTNGVYRYGYKGGTGYTGYEHSASLIQGWWAALYQDWIFDVYKEILAGFPLAQGNYGNIISNSSFFGADSEWLNSWFKYVLACAVQLGRDR